MADLTRKQREILLRPVNPNRVLVAQGQSHLPAFDVEAHLTRVFGYEGWDREIVSLWLIHETGEEKGGRVGWTVTYGCQLRLTVRNPAGEIVKVTDGCATGSANNLPSRGDAHDFAMKNADSYALKRCAKALGDQFGLSLYNKGSVKALVKSIVAYDQEAPEDYEKPETMGNDEREEIEFQNSSGGDGALPVADDLQARVAEISSKGRRYLDVPYKQRDEVKAAGGRWDAEAKRWWIPDDADVSKFTRWTGEESALFAVEGNGE